MRASEEPVALIKVVAQIVILISCTRMFSQTEKVLHSFTDGRDGGTPGSALISDRSGNLYGTTNDGGSYHGGTVFRLSISDGHWQETVLHDFGSGKDGILPQTSLSFDNFGNLYGTTSEGGSFGWGVVFQLKPTAQGWRETVLHNFSGGSDGSTPVAGLVLDKSGSLYGTATLGGHISAVCSIGCGTVFRLTPTSSGWRFSVIYEFRDILDGNDPESPMIFDKQGNLYGTTLGGGNGNGCIQDGGCGTIFKLTRSENQWRETILYRFQGINGDGAYPFGGLAMDQNGNLFGTTIEGGIYSAHCGGSCGTFFELFPGKGGWTEKVLFRFQGGSEGYGPVGTLASDDVGNFYGATHAGGGSGCDSHLGCGTVFRLSRTRTGWLERKQFVFPGGRDGWWPASGVILQGPHLYGTTSQGGNSNFGVAFEVIP